MFTRLSILCFLLFATGTAMACSCIGDEGWLKSLESSGLPANADIFRGRVERWISEKEIDVRVTEAFSGSRETRRLIAQPSAGGCSVTFPETTVGSEAIYVVQKSGFLSFFGAEVLGFCSQHWASPGTLDRLRVIAKRPQQDPAAEKARLEAAAANRATDEEILRTYKGERLFEPGKESSLEPRVRSQLPYVQADKATLGVNPVNVNRLAIDAPVTVFVIDGKEYRFVGNVSTTKPPPREKPARETGYWAVTDSWAGHTASGDRASITRDIWGMTGQINVGDRRFALNSRGGSGFLRELNPTLMAEREAEEKRSREARYKAAQQRAQSPANLPTVRPVAPTPQPQVLSNAEPCAQKTRFLSEGLGEAERYQQSAQLRSYIAELRATVKAEMRELQC